MVNNFILSLVGIWRVKPEFVRCANNNKELLLQIRASTIVWVQKESYGESYSIETERFSVDQWTASDQINPKNLII